MRVFYPANSLKTVDWTRAIFLAGPTPRSKDVKSWRPDAIQILTQLRFEGDIISPELYFAKNYSSQVEWEYEGLNKSKLVLFWVPRNLENMPAFTTNVEFGRYVGNRSCLYGRPDDSPNNKYLDYMYTRLTNNKPFNDLKELLVEAIRIVEKING